MHAEEASILRQEKMTMQSVIAGRGVFRQSVRRYSEYTARQHCRRPAVFLCTVTFSDMQIKRSGLLSLGGDLH